MKKASLFLMLTVLVFVSCENEDDPAQSSKVMVQFESPQLEFDEHGDSRLITLQLDKPAFQSGSVQVKAAGQGSRVVIHPAPVNGIIELPIDAGQVSVAFEVIPVDNATADGDMEIEFSLIAVSDGFQLGILTQLSATLIDNEAFVPFETTASFTPVEGKIGEDNAGGHSVVIQFGGALEAEGEIEITLSSQKAVYNTHFTTTPAAINDKIALRPALGSTSINVVIHPINNSVITGDMEIAMSITGTSGSIKTGSNTVQLISISDDELEGKPKGYVIGAGLWRLKKTYEYDELGRVSKVLVEGAAPAADSHTETYFYDDRGRIERINFYPQIDKVFQWTDGRITRSQNIEFGIVKQYAEYDYDAMGNVSGTAIYYRQLDGSHKLGLFIANLYFTDGNIHKSLTYSPVGDGGELVLISTTTYDEYSDSANPFPMVDILPNLKTQTKLPSTYRIETNGHDILYRLTYEFGENGLVSKRYATSGSQTETATYFYY